MRTLFYLALTAYFLGTVFSILYFLRRSRLFGRVYLGAVIVGFLAHTTLIGAIWIATGELPTASHGGSMVFFSWVIIALLALLEARYRLPVMGSFVLPWAFIPMLYAAFLNRTPTHAPALLRSGWFFAHTTLAFLAYAAFVIAFAGGIMYLLQERQVRSHRPGATFRRLPPLDTLDEVNRWAIALGFPLLTLGIVTGAIWAELAYGRLPVDPKVVWSVVTWLIYGAILNARHTFGWRGRKAAKLAIVGFGLMMFGYVVVNVHYTGFHSFRHAFRLLGAAGGSGM
ncbi:MAG: c-type cytochrome biogenesis protein CcsB [Nitrospirae bacterium]|nr:MAG: c-type cytochrome biogenesis protein CcsB [Nitrospirota bacterium]